MVFCVTVVLKTKIVVDEGVGGVVCGVQGSILLSIFPSFPQTAVIQVPSPSFVSYTISPYLYMRPL